MRFVSADRKGFELEDGSRVPEIDVWSWNHMDIIDEMVNKKLDPSYEDVAKVCELVRAKMFSDSEIADMFWEIISDTIDEVYGEKETRAC